MMELRIRPFVDQDYDKYVNLRNLIELHASINVEAARRDDKSMVANQVRLVRFVAEDDEGVLLGYAQARGDADGRYLVGIGVSPPVRRRGIGQALWKRLHDDLSARGARVARTPWTDASDTATLAFLTHQGFVETERAYALALDVTTRSFDRPGLEDTLVADPGITLTTLVQEQEEKPEAVLDVHATWNFCRQSQPPIQDHASSIPFERWHETMVVGPLALPDAYFLAKDGQRYVGMTTLQRHPRFPDGLEAGFTGVIPDYRGHGIGLALKLVSIRYARDRGYREIQTSNHADNLPMLRINRRLGFREPKVLLRYERSLS